MNTISEQNFKIVLDMSWTAFAKSVGLVNSLTDIGLDVTGDTSGSMTKFHELYAIQDKASSTILNILGIDSKRAGVDGRTIMEELDEFLYNIRDTYPNSERFPEKYYPDLLDILTMSGSTPLPWEDDAEDESDHGSYFKDAYWDVDRFGPFDNEASIRGLKKDGFRRFVTDISRKGDIVVWAHDESEAKDIVLTMRSQELEAYAELLDYGVPDIYEYTP